VTFLSAAFLLALPLIAIPVVIHLYRGRQRDIVPWGAMQFLAIAATQGRRMEKLEEWLLMALRFAAVAALVLALARPMIRSRWLATGADEQLVLVLDNSLSMSREVDGESPAQRMKEAALKAIDAAHGGVGAQILLTTGREWATLDDVAADGAGKRQLREIVDAIEPTSGAADLLSCVQAAVHLEHPGRRRVVVITDGQAQGWQLDEEAAWSQLLSERDEAKDNLTVEVIDCGISGAAIDNLAVVDVAAMPALLRPGEQTQLSAEVRNFGDVATGSLQVEWLVADQVVQKSATAPIAPQGSTRVTATFRPQTAGVQAITCQLKHSDQAALDQEEIVVIEVAEELPILFVESPDEVDGDVSPSELFAAALGYENNDAQQWHSAFRPQVVSPEALSQRPLAGCRAIVINNPERLDEAMHETLEAFVRSGGGLWLALGDRTDPEEFNRDWFRDGDGLSPLPVESLAMAAAADAAAAIHPPSGEHQATVQLANTTQLDIDEGRVTQRWVFGAAPTEDDATSVLLETGAGQPLVVEHYVGEGRVLVQAFPLGLEWANVPLLKAYVVMVHDWLNYMTSPLAASYTLEPGSPIVLSAAAEEDLITAEIVTPGGRTLPMASSDRAFAQAWRFSQTQRPGAYLVRLPDADGGAKTIPFQVQRGAAESDFRPLDDAERGRLTSLAGVQFGDGSGPTGDASLPLAPEPPREPVWGLLLAALVALLVGELLMANLLSRRRQPAAISLV
jgi:hypothetical protein